MSISIKVGVSGVPFDLYHPGMVLPGAKIALDTETKMASPGTVPQPVIASATDGAQGYFIAVQHLAAFVDAHRQKLWLMHNAAFDLAVLENYGVDLTDVVESGRLFDTGLLFKLLKLADSGSCHGRWSLDHVCSELLGLVLPKDERASDGRVVRVSFDRFLKADGSVDYACSRQGIDLSKFEKWDKKTLMSLLGPDGDKLRDQAKPVNFGFPGGLGPKSFGHYAKSSYGLEISDDAAKQEKEKWLTTWPEMNLHLMDSALLEFVQRFPQFWTGHPFIETGSSFAPDEIPWTFHIFKGVLVGRSETLTSKRKFEPKEISWAWFVAKWIAQGSTHLSDTERTILNTRIKERIAGQDLLDMIIPAQRFVATLTGRLRGYPAYCAAKNTVFQGLAADGAKRALYRLHREGFKVINFIHDEVLVAVREDSDCAAAAERVQKIMIEEMQAVVPDLPIKCEFALMRRWYKGAKAQYIDGKLVPVKPVVIDGKTKWIHDEK